MLVSLTRYKELVEAAATRVSNIQREQAERFRNQYFRYPAIQINLCLGAAGIEKKP